jgi:hypothetical protein
MTTTASTSKHTLDPYISDEYKALEAIRQIQYDASIACNSAAEYLHLAQQDFVSTFQSVGETNKSLASAITYAAARRACDLALSFYFVMAATEKQASSAFEKYRDGLSK